MVVCKAFTDPVFELKAQSQIRIPDLTVPLQLAHAPAQERAKIGASCGIGDNMLKIQQGNDDRTMGSFVKSREESLKLAFRMANQFDITGKIGFHNHGFEGVVDRGTVPKIIGLEHIGEEMHRRSLSFRRSEHGIQRGAIPFEHLGNHRTPGFLDVIYHDDKVTGVTAQETPGGQSDLFLIPVWNGLPAAYHGQDSGRGSDGTSLANATDHLKRAAGLLHQLPEESRQEIALALSRHDQSEGTMRVREIWLSRDCMREGHLAMLCPATSSAM